MPANRDALMQRFDSLGISVTTRDHAAVFTVDEAKLVHEDIPGGHCKNLFCKDEKGVLWLIVALEDSTINLKTVPAIIGSRRLSFGKPELLLEVLGLTPGSVTPFGLINDTSVRVNVILDAAMMAEPVLNFHPLENNATTSIQANDLVAFIRSCGHEPQIFRVSGLA